MWNKSKNFIPYNRNFRYNELLGNAQDRQAKLVEAVDLAERLTEGTVPLENWLAQV